MPAGAPKKLEYPVFVSGKGAYCGTEIKGEVLRSMRGLALIEFNPASNGSRNTNQFSQRKEWFTLTDGFSIDSYGSDGWFMLQNESLSNVRILSANLDPELGAMVEEILNKRVREFRKAFRGASSTIYGSKIPVLSEIITIFEDSREFDN